MTVLRGQVAVIHADGSAVQPAPSGTLVKAGDEIRTLTKTGALITFFTGTEIEMGEDTILAVDRIAVDGSKVDISLKQVFGTTLNRVQSLTDPSSVYRIDAGGATAVVRGTTFLLIGPVATSRGNISALICLDDCDGRTSFAGCQVAPFTAFGVQVGGGKAQSDCEITSVDKGADYWNAGFEAITTFEQSFASASGDNSPGVSNPGRDDGQRHADQRQDQQARDQKENVVVFSSCSIIAGGPPILGGSPQLIGGFGTVDEGNVGTTTLNVPVFLLPAATSTVTVNYTIGTAGTTATSGVDFVAGAGTLTFTPGTTQQNVAITVNGDVTPELNELVFVTLSGSSGAPIASSFAIGVIQDDDSPITISVLSTSVVEGNAGITNMQFTVTLSRTSPAPLSVDYQTIGAGTAIAGVDFTPVPLTTLNIPANTLAATFTVPILTDTTPEIDKTVLVQLSNPTGGAAIGVSTASGTIIDDDGPVSVSIGNVLVTEGCEGTTHAAFTLTLSHPSGTDVTVNYTTANGTATAGSDYQSTSGSVTFPPGTTTQTVTVLVIGDAIPEPDETFQVNLTSATGATIAVPSGTGTIQNDD